MAIIENGVEFQNTYAHNAEGKVIYIGDAESGRRGYFCMGCTNVMQAVHSRFQNRQSYFRHDAAFLVQGQKCTYSDETYRHKIAKEYLQMTKRIKVPAVYKFSSDRSGKGIVVKEAHFVEAYRVRNEVQFYEDADGNVKWGANGDVEKHLIIKPDVVFFDREDRPFLFIELVVTHKPDQEKRLKLLRLGIDTVSVILPRDSPESIVEVFNISTRTKWIYNYLYETTEYLSVSSGDTEEFLSLMKSKDSFLQSLSNAERRKLETLYEELQDVWNLNHIESLQQRLNMSYQELREMQNSYEENLRERQTSIDEELNCEKQMQQQVLSEQETRINELSGNVSLLTQNWNKNISIKQKSLSEQENFLMLKSNDLSKEMAAMEDILSEENKITLVEEQSLASLLIGFEIESQRLSVREVSLLKELEQISDQNRRLSSENNLEEKTYQQDIRNWEQALLKERENLKLKTKKISDETKNLEIPYQSDLKDREERLSKSMMNYVDQQLVVLKKKIISETPSWPKDIKDSYLEPGNSTMRLKYNAIANEAEQLKNFLQKEHTKYGFESMARLEDVFEKYIAGE